MTFGSAFLFGNTRLTCHAQTGFGHSLGKSFAHLVVQHFILNGVAITLRHHIHGHLARTETVHLHSACNLLQTRFNFGLDRSEGQAQRDFALKLLESFNCNGHGDS